jgi:post-segregation antitoxin (ccd killing protein)
MAARKQANFLLSEELVEELRHSVEKRELSRFVEAALEKELKRLKLEKALQVSFGAWKVEEHPELVQGIEKFVRTTRKSARGRRR